MNEQDFALIAYVIVNGKTGLTDDEKARLTRIASRHLRSGDRVDVTLGLPGAGNPTVVAGAIDEIRDDGLVKVTLDNEIETDAGGMTVETTTVIVARGQVSREVTTPTTP